MCAASRFQFSRMSLSEQENAMVSIKLNGINTQRNSIVVMMMMMGEGNDQ